MNAPINIYVPIQFNDHYGMAEHNGRVYNFRSSEAAAKFLAQVSKRQRSAPHARDCHKPALRVPSSPPECIRRELVKEQLQVLKSSPPPSSKPPKINKIGEQVPAQLVA